MNETVELICMYFVFAEGILFGVQLLIFLGIYLKLSK